MVTTKQKFTASELVLLAASDLTAAGNQEFSEWDLTVAAWSIDRFRFGLRGYAQSYPDHKRVMMEIMGQKPSSPVQQKYLEKLRPNFYRLTPLGRAAAQRLRGGGNATSLPEPTATAKPVTVKELYETAAVYVNRPEFKRWRDNPEEPKSWDGAAAFLGILKGDKVDANERLDEVRDAIKDAMDWCKVQEAAFLTRGSGQGGTAIHVRDLAEMLDFLQALVYRFPENLDKKGGGPRHPRKRFD
jgi:hypothetical protein